MPGIVVVDNQAGRDWGQVPAELARRTDWKVMVATMPLSAQLNKFEGGVLVGTGDGAFYQEKIVGSIYTHHLQFLHGDGLIAKLAGHLLVLENT